MTVVSLRANVDQTFQTIMQATDATPLREAFITKRPSVTERLRLGKALREKVSRAA